MICQYCGHKLTDGKCLNPACPGRLRREAMSELKPCPFCGGVAARDIILEDGSNYGGEIIGCKRCLASTRVFFGEKEGLEESWNTRTPAPAEVEDLLDNIISAANSVSIPSESNYLNELKSRLLAAFSNTTPYLSQDVSVGGCSGIILKQK